MLIRTKITPKSEKKNEPNTNIPCSHEILNLDNSSKKKKFRNNFLISNSTLD